MNTNSKNKITTEELEEIKSRIISYREDFYNKRNKILLSHSEINIDKIVDKFTFQNLKNEYPGFCNLFKKDKSCHSMSDLNCYNCICPNYEIEITVNDEDNLYKIGKCRINSEFGFYKLTQAKADEPKSYYILNCKNCNIPHNRGFVKELIEKDLSINSVRDIIG